MGLLGKVLMSPALGGPILAHWIATTLTEEGDRRFMDEGRVRGDLLELQQRYDAGEIGLEEYEGLEEALLEQLVAIREELARRSQPPSAARAATR